MSHEENPDYFKGRGSQVNTHNKFLKNKYVLEHIEGLDEPMLENTATQLYVETPKKIVSESNSPDLSHMYSINPYQGCEHGCIYCYARNTHEYFGFSAGLDFERKIIVKPTAPALLEAAARLATPMVPAPMSMQRRMVGMPASAFAPAPAAAEASLSGGVRFAQKLWRVRGTFAPGRP